MKELNLYEALKDIISDSKEFLLEINGNCFTVNSGNIIEFVSFLEKNLKNKYIPINLALNLEYLFVDSIKNAYFPKKKKFFPFSRLWPKSGLPYSLKRLK